MIKTQYDSSIITQFFNYHIQSTKRYIIIEFGLVYLIQLIYENNNFPKYCSNASSHSKIFPTIPFAKRLSNRTAREWLCVFTRIDLISL